jgi:hypothetical protein
MNASVSRVLVVIVPVTCWGDKAVVSRKLAKPINTNMRRRPATTFPEEDPNLKVSQNYYRGLNISL